jgi:hypothetical protein
VVTDDEPSHILDMMNRISSGLLFEKSDSVVYSANENATLKMPSSLTVSFDVIRDKLRLSYTKTFGEIEMYHSFEGSLGTDSLKKIVDMDVGITMDNIIMLNIDYHSFFLNTGIFTIDVRIDDQKNLLKDGFSGSLPHLQWGDAVMLPVVNMGTAIGAKTQLAIELDLLPIFAVKTGVVYHLRRF